MSQHVDENLSLGSDAAQPTDPMREAARRLRAARDKFEWKQGLANVALDEQSRAFAEMGAASKAWDEAQAKYVENA